MVGNAAAAITDLIWTINPRPETLDDLMARIQKDFASVFKEKEIAFIIDIRGPISKILLKARWKQNIYLILKEALNNCLKYAKADEVKVVIDKASKKIAITIIDNGVGFDQEFVKNKGHGLVNMDIRAKEMQADLRIQTEKDKGTSISFSFTPAD